MRYVLVAVVSILAISTSLRQLTRASDGVEIVSRQIGPTPVTIFRLASAKPGPVVVIAHGFAGSQQLMQPFALTFARNGYVAMTFDFLGHGRHPEPLPGGLADHTASARALLNQLGAVMAFAAEMPSGAAKPSLLGHSMASDIVIRYAQAHPEVAATIAVSVFAPEVTATSPRNLLVIDGALEPSFLQDEGKRIVGLAARGLVQERTTYGDFTQGTARRLVLADSVEHIGVLYSRDSMAEALDWLNQVYKQRGSGFTDVRGAWLGLLYLGLIALAWPLSRLLPVVSAAARGSGLPWRRLIPVAVAPAVLTPLLLWKLPTEFLPILLGDYLALHFGLYGILTAGGLLLVKSGSAAARKPAMSFSRLAIAAAACVTYGVVAVGVPTNLFVTNLMPTAGRMPLVAALLAGTLLYALADEWLTRGPAARRGSYAFTKLCFLMSLGLAIGLNPQKLFFLIIIVPAILLIFIIYGLFSGWAYQRTNDPVAGALCTAVTFACVIAVTFPIVAR